MRQELKDLYDIVDQLVDQVKQLGSEAEYQAADAGTSVAGAERHVFAGLMELGLKMLGKYVAAVGPGEELPEDEQAAFHRRQKRSITLLTVFGPLSVPRFVYYGAGERRVPTAEAMNLPDRQASYFVQQLLSRLAVKDTYEEAVSFFEVLFGQRLSTHTVDEIVGEQAMHAASFNEQSPLPELPQEDEVQVVSLDGKGVPVIKKPQGERPPPRLKQGEKRQRKRESLVGVDYVVKRHVRSARSVALSLVMPDLLSDQQEAELHARERARDLHYEASILDKESVPQALQHRLERKQQTRSTAETVCLIDGSPHLAKLAATYFPGAPVVLDIIHVCEYLWQAAHAVHGDDSQRTTCLTVTAWLTTILEGRVGHVIGGLKQRSNHLKGSAKKTLKSTITYLDNHRDCMHYDTYLAKGYPIGTGVIESACGHLVKDRMEKSGARWSPQGAEAMLKLRALYASGDWKAYLHYREDQEHQRLYAKAS